MKNYKLGVLVVIACVLMATSASAALLRVGPLDVPSPPGNGFPFWYQDTTGLTLDLCLPANAAQLNSGICLILPTALDPATGFDLPFVFPTNFPDESFYWNATVVGDLPGGGQALLVLGLEAAFNGGPAAINDQLVFARVRVRIDAPVAGNYTVTYPFGVLDFPSVPAGIRTINFTSDLAPLATPIGPYLVAADAVGNPLPLITAPGDLSGDQFLADPAVPVFVTGSPAGTNYFEVCTDAAGGLDGLGTACLRFDQFALMGKVHQGAIGSPLTIDRATYARDAASAHVDVFATATPGPGAAVPVLSVGDAAGVSMPSVLMSGPTPMDKFYGQGTPPDVNAVPTAVVVTNTADVPPSSVTHPVVDEVTITEASYDTLAGTLTIVATSSDKLTPHQLFAAGLPGSATGSEPLVSTANPADPAEQQLVAFPVGPVPPDPVLVTSAAGGQDTEPVTTSAAAFNPGAPVAVDDFATTPAPTAVVINVIGNDSGFDPLAPSVHIVGLPAVSVGTAFLGPNPGEVTFTPAPGFLGDATFTYVLEGPAPDLLQSNVAVVTVTVFGVNLPPVANADSTLVAPGGSIDIPVLANDTDSGVPVDPLAVTVNLGLFAPGQGTVTVLANNRIRYTANVGATGADVFTYSVTDAGGLTSNEATVTVTFTGPIPETVTVTRALYRTGSIRWRVDGTTTALALNTMTIVLTRTGQTIGTAPVDPLTGAWTLITLNSPVVPIAGDTIRVTSSFGNSVTATVTVRD